MPHQTEYYEKDGLRGVKGEAPFCPKCGNKNAMLDHEKWTPWTHVYKCRDCGYIHGEVQLDPLENI